MLNLIAAALLAALAMGAGPALAAPYHNAAPPHRFDRGDFYWTHHHRRGHWAPCPHHHWQRCWVWG